MAQEYEKRFVTKDGKTRISIYRDEYAKSPRDMTDEPLHCEDWNRDWSIMNKREKETKSENARSWIRYMLERYGNTKAIFEVLRNNAKSDKHDEGDNALVYDKSRHEWILNYWNGRWTDWHGEIHGNCWSEEASFCCKIKDLTAWDIASYLSDEQIEAFADKKYFTDGIKIGSYTFDYYGGISFRDWFSADSEGIFWLEKDEFLKYSGCKEEYWKKDLRDIEFLIDEIEAWCDNEVYGFVVEKKHRFKLHKEYLDEDKEDECTEDEEWEEADSCWGFYGELDKSLEWILESARFKIEELEEVA